MKKYINNIIFACAVALSFMACTEDEIDTFSGVDTLYFQWAIDGTNEEFFVASSRIDSIPVSFAFELPEVVDSIFKVPVKVLGNVTSTDRSFMVEVLPTSTAIEGVHFNMPENLFIPANENRAFVPITILRTPEMKDEEVSIQIGLVPNNYFNTDYFGTTENGDTKNLLKYNEFEMAVSDMLTEPNLWSRFAVYYLGDFSVKKLILFAQVNGIPIPDWCCDYPDLGVFTGQKNIFKAYLIDQKNNGTPVLEEDGTEMTAGPY